jgi:hypothetical protein
VALLDLFRRVHQRDGPHDYPQAQAPERNPEQDPLAARPPAGEVPGDEPERRQRGGNERDRDHAFRLHAGTANVGPAVTCAPPARAAAGGR